MFNETSYSDDKTLCSLIAKGDVRAFECLYNKYFSSLNRFSFHMLLCDHSHDIVQEVFTKLWITKTNLPVDINIKSYLYTSVKNSSLNYLKHLNIVDDKKSLIVEATLFVEDAWSDESDNELFDKVLELVDALPQQQRKVIKLKFEGKSYKDISNELDISVKTVNNHIVKAYTFIREILVVLLFFFFLIK